MRCGERNNSMNMLTLRKMVPATIAAYGGRFLVRGPEMHQMEGQ